jgi:hypothetical protein
MEAMMFIVLFWLLKACMAAVALLVPFYIGIYMSLWWLYAPQDGGAHPIAGQFWQMRWVMKHYQQLLDFWRLRDAPIGLELFAPPIAGALLGLVCLYLFSRYVRSIFRL